MIAEDFAPRLFETNDFAALTPRHFTHAVAEEAIGEGSDLGTGLDEIADRRFHAAAAGGRDDEGHLVLGAEHGAQHALNVVGDLKEVSVKMADDRLRHRLVDAGMNLAGAGSI